MIISPSLLLTRSKSANIELRERLSALKLDLVECNLIEYKMLPVDADYINNFSDLIITSNFAANNVPETPRSNMPVWVVGEKSARTMADKGYKVEFYAPSAESLKKQIPEKLYETMLYLSADQITVNMPFAVTRRILYEVKYLESLSKAQVKRYKQGVDYIVLYSENCAKTLLKLLIENSLVNYLENTTIIAISSKVGRVFEQMFKNVVIGHDSDSILKYIETRHGKRD